MKSRLRRAAYSSSCLTLGLLVALVLAAQVRTTAVAVRDATGRTVTVNDPSRIVSIGGSVTEILYALGMERQIIAIDTTSLYPPQASRDKRSVGYMRQLSPEGILGLAPTLILTVEGAGPRETLAVLEQARVPMVVVADSFDGPGIFAKIGAIAAATGAADRGKCLAAAVQSDLEALAALRRRIAGRPLRVLFILSLVDGRAMVAGRKTAADGIIRMAGGINAIAEYEGYKPISNEAAVAAKPDFVLVMERSGAASITAAEVFAHPAFATSPAAAGKSFAAMEGLYLLGFGPRTARAARDLAGQLYPSLKPGPMPSERGGRNGEACKP